MAQSRISFGRWVAGGAVASAILLSGCADTGIDLNGKVFDMMGLSPAAQASKKTEPKMAERAPPVMPPDFSKLPQPGSGQAPVTQAAWPDDPEQRKVIALQEREKLHLAYCRGDMQWKERALDTNSIHTPRSPYGPCPTILGGVTVNSPISINGKDKDKQ
jgi:hypothetical protein